MWVVQGRGGTWCARGVLLGTNYGNIVEHSKQGFCVIRHICRHLGAHCAVFHSCRPFTLYRLPSHCWYIDTQPFLVETVAVFHCLSTQRAELLSKLAEFQVAATEQALLQSSATLGQKRSSSQ